MSKTSKASISSSIKHPILVVSHSPHIGGAELALLDMLDYFVNQGMSAPHFILPDKGGLSDQLKLRKWPFTVISYSVWAWPVALNNTEDIFRERLKNFAAVDAIKKVIDKLSIKLVLTNTVVCPWGALAAGVAGIPHAWYVHEYGNLDHGLVFEQGTEASFQDIGIMSDLVIANSEAIHKYVARFVEDQKIMTAYIPYDVSKIELLASKKTVRYYKLPKALKLIQVGRVTPSKGQLDAVRAVGLLKQRNVLAELCIVGSVDDATYMRVIEEAVKLYDISDRVAILSYVNNPFPLIKQADVGLTCSELEAFGRTTFEYIILGKPVVGTNAGGTTELVRDGNSGFLYKKGDVKALADILEQYVADGTLIAKHSKQAKAVARDVLQGAHSAGPLYARLNELAANGRAAPVLPSFVNQFTAFGPIAEQYKIICEANVMRRLAATEARLNRFLKLYYSRPGKIVRLPIRIVQKAKRTIRRKL